MSCSGAGCILELLNGVKKLVMGNHDRYPCALYLEYFSQVVGTAETRGCILTHVPVHPSQFGRYKANIHGHLHSSKMDDVRYINVSAEHTENRYQCCSILSCIGQGRLMAERRPCA